MAIDPDAQHLYGLSTPDGVFFVYDIGEQAVREVGPINAGKQFSDVLVVDLAGDVYGVGAAGRLFRLHHRPGRNRTQAVPSTASSRT